MAAGSSLALQMVAVAPICLLSRETAFQLVDADDLTCTEIFDCCIEHLPNGTLSNHDHVLVNEVGQLPEGKEDRTERLRFIRACSSAGRGSSGIARNSERGNRSNRPT